MLTLRSVEIFSSGERFHLYYMASFFDDERHQRYLDWLMTRKQLREPSTVSELAKELRVNRRTLHDWKYNPEFVKEWEKQVREGIGSPEVMKDIMDVLRATATNPEDGKHVQAAQSYMKILKELSPPEDAKVDFGLEKLSKEELESLLAKSVQAELEKRELKLVEDQ